VCVGENNRNIFIYIYKFNGPYLCICKLVLAFLLSGLEAEQAVCNLFDFKKYGNKLCHRYDCDITLQLHLYTNITA